MSIKKLGIAAVATVLRSPHRFPRVREASVVGTVVVFTVVALAVVALGNGTANSLGYGTIE
jgi:hypothetical protein